MKIISAQYTVPDNSMLMADLDSGETWYMPQPCETWHQEILDAFLADGGVIEPLPDPTGLSAPTPSHSVSGPAPGVLPLNRWPKASLQHLLDSLNIAYPANATVADLAALVPDSHQHHIAEEIPVPSWDNARIVQWLEKEGVDIPDALRDDKDNLMEMVHDVIELKAGIPIDPGFVAPLPKDQWPAPPNLDRTSRNQLAAWMSVSIYPIVDAHAVRPLLEACTKAELGAMLDGTRPLPDTSHLPAASS